MQSRRQPPTDETPGDACPYQRPFSNSFHQCVAYVPVAVQVASGPAGPARTIWTCGHLTSGPNVPLEGSGYYPRCALGDYAARERWAWSRRAGRSAQPPDRSEFRAEPPQVAGPCSLYEVQLRVDLAAVLERRMRSALSRAARVQAEARARLTGEGLPGTGKVPYGKPPGPTGEPG